MVAPLARVCACDDRLLSMIQPRRSEFRSWGMAARGDLKNCMGE
jgi:hypothetical protein